VHPEINDLALKIKIVLANTQLDGQFSKLFCCEFLRYTATYCNLPLNTFRAIVLRPRYPWQTPTTIFVSEKDQLSVILTLSNNGDYSKYG